MINGALTNYLQNVQNSDYSDHFAPARVLGYNGWKTNPGIMVHIKPNTIPPCIAHHAQLKMEQACHDGCSLQRTWEEGKRVQATPKSVKSEGLRKIFDSGVDALFERQQPCFPPLEPL